MLGSPVAVSRSRHRGTRWLVRQFAGVKGLLALLAAAVALVLLNSERDTGADAGMALGRCQVASVRDGDTLILSCLNGGTLRVRLWGVDAPELGQSSWGRQAHQYLSQRAVGEVRVEPVDRDRYGRLVARLYRGPQDLGLDLVRAGWAEVYAPFNRRRDYLAARNEARQAGRGVWSAPGLQQTPWEWRNRNPRGD